MILIPDNTTLRSFIPNTMAPVKGETTLFDKIKPFLVAAENWFCENLIPLSLLQHYIEEAMEEDDPLYFLPRRIVCLQAWMNAVPAIDVVVGPTGVGVTETASLKPAAKAKIDNLIASTIAERDRNIESLIAHLRVDSRWIGSRAADKFRCSLFPDFRVVDAMGVTKERWTAYLGLTHKASVIEDIIGRRWISTEVLQDLRSRSILPDSDDDHNHHGKDRLIREVTELLRDVELDVMRSDSVFLERNLDKERLCDITNTIRRNPDVFPKWRHSSAAGRFNGPVFENRKESSGYWL